MPKEYGEHKYNNGLCICGCWSNSLTSGGPVGLDPKGKCPKNPKDGVPIGGLHDFEEVAKERIASLYSKIQNLEDRLKKAEQDLKEAKQANKQRFVGKIYRHESS